MTPKIRCAALLNYIVARIAIGEYRPGDRIPSIRRLAAKFKVSYGSAFRALSGLVASGQLAADGHSGGYRVAGRERSVPGERLITIFWDNTSAYPGGIQDTVFGQIRQQAVRAGYRIGAVPAPRREWSAEMILKNSGGADAVILIGEYDQYLEQGTLPVPAAATLFGEDFRGTVSTVNPDPFLAAEQAVAYFRDRGVEYVVAMGEDTPVARWRCRIFAFLWDKAGGSCLPENEAGGIRDRRKVGYYLASDRYAERFLEVCREEDIVLSADHLLSMDGERLLVPGFSEFPTMAVDWPMIGNMLFWEVHHRLLNPNYPIRHLLLPGGKFACGELS